MKTYLTEFHAIDTRTGRIEKFIGDEIRADSIEKADKWCEENKPFLRVIGELIENTSLNDFLNIYGNDNRILN